MEVSVLIAALIGVRWRRLTVAFSRKVGAGAFEAALLGSVSRHGVGEHQRQNSRDYVGVTTTNAVGEWHSTSRWRAKPARHGRRALRGVDQSAGVRLNA